MISHAQLHTHASSQTQGGISRQHRQANSRQQRHRGSAARFPSRPGSTDPGHTITLHAQGGKPGAFILPTSSAG
ncbi:MAG: hypothetical protein F4040_03265, partial [Synechococcus sp. SB0670_bin_20]|nr:hypothetical protein [Synechococcus sp. SB0670_bin_20]